LIINTEAFAEIPENERAVLLHFEVTGKVLPVSNKNVFQLIEKEMKRKRSVKLLVE